MSLKYSLMMMKNPQRPDESPKVYARSQIREVVDLNRIAEEISYATSLTDGDVLNVLRGLIRNVKEHLSDGDLIDLAEFGRFQYQISSTGVVSKEEFTPAAIRGVRLQFRPGKLLKPQKDNFQFERVMSVKARKEAKKNEYEGIN